jgi:hypothetical protein
MTLENLAAIRERKHRGARSGALAYGVVAVALFLSALFEASRSSHLATTYGLRVSDLLTILLTRKGSTLLRSFSGPEVAFLLGVGTAVVQVLLLGLVGVVALSAHASIKYQRRLWTRIDDLEREGSANRLADGLPGHVAKQHGQSGQESEL